MKDVSLTRRLALVAIGILMSGALVVLVSTRYFPLSFNKVDIVRGQGLFDQTCAGCHAVDADGAAKMGPWLGNIGQVAAVRKPDMSSVDYILESILQPDVFRADGVEGHMPANTTDGLSDSELRDLVAYLAGNGSTADYNHLLELDISNRPVPERAVTGTMFDRMRGWELFSEKLGCSACHSIYSIPGSNLAAPSLQLASQYSVQYLRESILNPSKMFTKGYRPVTVTTTQGNVLSGRLISESDDQLVLFVRTSSGEYERMEFSTESLAAVVRSEVSPMPAYVLSQADESALIAFLKFLQGG